MMTIVPNNLDAERVVIKAILDEPDLYGTLKSEQFFGLDNALVYKRVGEIIESGITPDLVLIKNELGADKELIGGEAYFEMIAEYEYLPENFNKYVDLILETYHQRGKISIAKDIIDGGFKKPVNDFIDKLNNLQTKSNKRFVSWEDLNSTEYEIPGEVLQGLITEKSLVMFSGDGGIGKSYVLLELAHFIAHGEEWNGLKTMKLPVLFIDVENREYRIAERVKRIKRAHELPDGNINFCFVQENSLDTNAGAEEILKAIEITGAKVVILDSLIDFIGDYSENDNPDMAKVCARLRYVCEEADVTVIAIHHVGKMAANSQNQTARGASALRDNADISIQTTRVDFVMNIKHDKYRDGPYTGVKVTLSWMNNTFSTISKESLKPVVIKKDKGKQAILDILLYDEWMSLPQLIEKATESSGQADTTIRRKVNSFIELGYIKVDGGEIIQGRTAMLKLGKQQGFF